MNRAEVLDRMKTLRDEKDAIIRAVMERFDLDMRGKSSDECRKALLGGGTFTAEEWKQMDEIKEKIEGFKHALREGFFSSERSPKDPSAWVKELLYY